MKNKKIILIAGITIVAAGALIIIISQAALNKRRMQIDNTIVPPGYADTIIQQVAAQYGLK